MKVVFMGTPEFALPSLQAISDDEGFNIVGVVTQPDRPRGRGKKLAYPPVKKLAIDLDIDYIQPESVNSKGALEIIARWDPEVVVVTAYGQILGVELLGLPPLGCINLHASLLPKYRGAAPIHWAVINGEKKTGVTTMYMDEGMDTGDIILQEDISIEPTSTAGDLHDELAERGSKVLLKTLHQLSEGKITRTEQDHDLATYAPPLKNEDAAIDWNKKAGEIVNHIRGMNPWPGAYTIFNDMILKVWGAKVRDNIIDGKPGEIIKTNHEEGFIVQARDGQVLVSHVQPQSKRRMLAVEFMRGYDICEGQFLHTSSPKNEIHRGDGSED
ncbi:MAG: methionyl-tRNA formyltransferase [Clostridia bacterium]|nr:methionyl-tRNA formyltransferase [Clostridia bacterium]